MSMISIVIPTYNEAARITATLASIRRCSDESNCEIVVSDGGSDDNTVSVAQPYGRVIQGSKGKAKQLNAGARHASGDILFFVHADMLVPLGALRIIKEKLIRGDYDGGGFSNMFSDYNRRIKSLGRILNLRVWDNDHTANTIFFGDNGIFVKRCVFEALGGFRPLPIMEDYEFSDRLRRRFRVVRIENPRLVVSPRRHINSGFVRTRLQWIAIKHLYRLGVSPCSLARWYGDVR